MFSKKTISILITSFFGFLTIIYFVLFLVNHNFVEENNEILLEDSNQEKNIDENCKFDSEMWTETKLKNETEIIKICQCIDNIKSCDEIKPNQADDILEEYWDNINIECETNLDCAIKDIHNCCGYYPKCVNIEFETKVNLVRDLCKVSQKMPICGFQTINSCACINGRCVGEI